MKTMIHENERGLLFVKGKFVKCLGAGTYRVPRRGEIEVVPAAGELVSAHADADTLLSDPVLCEQTERVVVTPQQAVIRLQDGAFDAVVPAGEHLFWKKGGSFLRFDTSRPEIAADVPLSFVEKWAPFLLVRADVKDGEAGKLYFDNKFVRMLEPGKYLFWANGTQIGVKTFCLRPQIVEVNGQEILTRDKVGVRINFTFCYRLTDAERAEDASDVRSLLYTAAQLALRAAAGTYTLDELLEKKDELCACVREKLEQNAAGLYAEICEAGVKDIILPGEIRDIMNTVLVAEKRAQANVVTRREEVASTRSLLNTARLMEENPTLYKLKELEYVEKICERVGSISLSGGDIVGQLQEILHLRKGGKT